jgi:hypothetical protein
VLVQLRQQLELTNQEQLVSRHIESERFWSHYTAGREKGRVVAYGLATADDVNMTDDEFNHFLSWAKLNDFIR